MQLNQSGNIIKTQWEKLPEHYTNCVLDQFIIMPNHLHGILIIDYCMQIKKGPKHTLSEIIRGFKTFSSRQINLLTTNKFSWQRSLWELEKNQNKNMY
jgi:REP element-mobilizing transposase RayT